MFNLVFVDDLLLHKHLHSVKLSRIVALNLLHEVDSAVRSGSEQLQDLKVSSFDFVSRVKGV